MNLAINSKIARNIVIVVINIKTKCLKITKKPSKISKSQGWWRGRGGCGYYWLILGIDPRTTIISYGVMEIQVGRMKPV